MPTRYIQPRTLSFSLLLLLFCLLNGKEIDAHQSKCVDQLIISNSNIFRFQWQLSVCVSFRLPQFKYFVFLFRRISMRCMWWLLSFSLLLPMASLIISNLGLVSFLPSYLYWANKNTTSWSTQQRQKTIEPDQREHKNEGEREPNRNEQMRSGIINNVLCRSFVIVITALFFGIVFWICSAIRSCIWRCCCYVITAQCFVFLSFDKC